MSSYFEKAFAVTAGILLAVGIFDVFAVLVYVIVRPLL